MGYAIFMRSHYHLYEEEWNQDMMQVRFEWAPGLNVSTACVPLG